MEKCNYVLGPVSQTFVSAIDSLNQFYNDITDALEKSNADVSNEDFEKLALSIQSVKDVVYGFFMKNIQVRKEFINNKLL